MTLPFPKAFKILERVMLLNEDTHRHNEWLEHSDDFHRTRAQRHLTRLWLGDETGEDNLAHAAVRCLMALERRDV